MSAIQNQAKRWIDLHEAHRKARLSEVDPFLGSMAALPPFGDNFDVEYSFWEQRSQRNFRYVSLAEYRDRAEFLRYRMRILLDAIEPMLSSGDKPANRLDAFLATLRTVYSEFLALQNSPFAWQDISSEDIELLSKAAIFLGTFGRPSYNHE